MDFKSFKDFYPYYLRQHSDLSCRRMHFIGTCSVISLLILFFFTGHPGILVLLPVVGYGFAWLGHIFFERQKPLTFKHPFYSLLADFKMFWEILAGKVKAF